MKTVLHKDGDSVVIAIRMTATEWEHVHAGMGAVAPFKLAKDPTNPVSKQAAMDFVYAVYNQGPSP